MTSPAPRRRTRRLRRRRIAGWTMIVVGVLSAIAAIAGVVVGRSLLGNTERAVDESLVVTEEALTSIDDTLLLADDVLDTVARGVGTVNGAVGEVEASFDDIRVAVDGVAGLAGGDVADSIDTVTSALPQLVDAASTIEGLLDDLGSLPLAPDYDPDVRISAVLGDLEADLVPLADELRVQAAAVQEATAGIEGLDDGLGELGGELTMLERQLDDSRTLLEEYRATTTRAADLTARTRDDLASDTAAARILVVVLGVLIAAGQLAPIWTGIELLRSPVDPV